MSLPEVLSPAGYWPQLRAAVEAGADAVYFGLKHFSARAKAGFSLDELPEVMRTLHSRGVRGYVTFNTLIFEHEIAEAARAIAAIAQAGADAMIVQDYGALRLAREIVPEMEFHASTQMSITNAEGVRFAREAGVERVTLARELSLDEVRSIIDETGCPVEIFVHGALCVAYSGQCLSSEAWGGRSANRGQCAQACRLPYQMMVDGELKPLEDARYLLSPGDLYALEQVPEIIKIGVAAMKIEGRYKDAEYVALTTSAYRKAVDGEANVSARQKLQLEQVYSRGLGPFFMTGTNHQAVVTGRAPRHRGVLMGRVVSVGSDSAVIETADAHRLAPLKAGDGVVFDAADWRSPQEPEEGGRVFEAREQAGRMEIRFGNGLVRFDRIRAGDLLWRTHDPDLDRAARPFLDPPAPVARQPVDVHVVAENGAPLASKWSLARRPEISVEVKSEAVLQQAQNRALSVGAIREKFGRLGNTPFLLNSVSFDAENASFLRISALNQMRREAVQRLEQAQTRLVYKIHEFKPKTTHLPRAGRGTPRLHLLVRTPAQLDAAIEIRPESITLDYLDLYGLRPSVERVKSSGIGARVASPRVLKPGEQRILNFLRDVQCPILARSSGMLESLRGIELTGDFSLNAANSMAAEDYLALGLSRLTPAHDLNAAQVAALARAVGGAKLEALAYHHLPVFHTEHCVFCRFLSTGTSYRDCGRPCEKHRAELKDGLGRAHPVMADVGCRNTVFGAEAQEASAHLKSWLDAGIVDFRLEFVHESTEQVIGVARAFESALAGKTGARELASELKRIAPQGVTEGSLYVPDDYLKLPILQ